MKSNKFSRPTLMYFYGPPGSGKTFVSRQISEYLGAAHVSAERIRYELFDEPHHDKTEFDLINQLMNYMTEEFLKAGVSVVYDASVSRMNDRKNLRELARRYKSKDLMIWIQVDLDTSWARLNNRDKRKADDKYACQYEPETFKQYVRIMQPPQNEDYLVISGKHLFNSQRQAIFRRLMDMNVLNLDAFDHKIPKPELVNLVSKAHAGRVDHTRRNISIR